MTGRSRSVRWGTRLYRACLWLVPSAIRRSYGADMIATFEAAAHDARRAGHWTLGWLLLHEIVDLAWSRRATRPGSTRTGQRRTSRPDRVGAASGSSRGPGDRPGARWPDGRRSSARRC